MMKFIADNFFETDEEGMESLNKKGTIIAFVVLTFVFFGFALLLGGDYSA